MHSDASFIVACMCQPYIFLPLQRDIPSSPDSVKLLMTTESQKSDYEHRLKKKVKLLICCVAFLVTIIVILAVLFGVLFSKQAKSAMQPTQSSWESVYPCITKECVLTSTGDFVKAFVLLTHDLRHSNQLLIKQ